MTPEPADSAARCWGMPPPKNWKKGSAWTRWIERAEMLTTAGAASRTTGAKLCFIVEASVGVWRSVGSAKTPSWALVELALPQAASVRQAARAIIEVFIVVR